MGRKILAVVLGLVVGSVVNMALVTLSSKIYPLPSGVDPSDMESFRLHIEENGLATGAWLIVLAAHAGGSLVSGLVCGLIAKKAWVSVGIGLGAFWMCGGIYMLTILPSPMWFAASDVLLYVPAAIAGVTIGGQITSPKINSTVDEAT
ncbi:MAG: hypothetical protein AAGI63_06710 [Planctomycetota bacterium]